VAHPDRKKTPPEIAAEKTPAPPETSPEQALPDPFARAVEEIKTFIRDEFAALRKELESSKN
jgi:hypothetical protein